MPKIEASKKDFEKLIGKRFSEEELIEALNYAKVELDGLEEDKMILDSKDANRPDLWSIEGIARQVKGKFSEKGIPKYKVKKGKNKIIVDKSVKEIRPCSVGAIVKGIKIDDEILKQIIQLQEKVAMTFGRKRKEAAIGVYDFDKIKFPLYYTTKDRKFKFIPLGYKVEMDLEEILETHEKGKEYGYLLEKSREKNKFPIIIDSRGEVASMPPIINSAISGQVSSETKNLFIEVTGHNIESVSVALNVIVSALADRGGKIESVEVEGKDYPDFKEGKIRVEKKYAEKILGMELKETEYRKLLEEARYEVKGKEVRYAGYRQDILHPIDVVEDLIISYGYNKIEPKEVRLASIGKENIEHLIEENSAELGVGAGMQEVLNFTMTDKESQEIFETELVEIANPVSNNYNVFRANIFPQLLKFLGKNKDKRMPQHIFEIGRCLIVNEKEERGVDEYLKFSCLVLDSKVDYNYMKALLDSFSINLEFEYKSEREEKFFEKGIRIDNGMYKGYCGILKKEFGFEKIGVLEFCLYKF